MTDRLPFPLWQLDADEYAALCAHLGLSPKPAIHARLNAHLGRAPLRHAAPQGFSRFLAAPALTRWRIARLDQATRWIDRGHPLRHALNATIALHECDADGHAQMSASPQGARVWVSMAGWALAYVAGLVLTVPWLAAQRLRYLPRALSGVDRPLHGARVLVTGAAGGLGRDLMLECLERGARVVGCVRSEASRDTARARLPAEAPVEWLVADLSVPGRLVAALDGAGIAPCSLSMALLCAGVKHDGASVLAADALRETFEVNLFAAVEFARWWCVPDASGGGDRAPRSLVLVSSMGRWHGMYATGGYNASKAALSIWGESLEMEFGRDPANRTSVCIVEPGLFDSGMTQRTGWKRGLIVPRRAVAAGIVDGALAGRRTLRPPRWFAWLTWALVLAGRRLRARVLGRARDASKGTP